MTLLSYSGKLIIPQRAGGSVFLQVAFTLHVKMPQVLLVCDVIDPKEPAQARAS